MTARQREEALELVLQVLQAVESWVQTLEPEETVSAAKGQEVVCTMGRM